MPNAPLATSILTLLVTVAALAPTGCARSRADQLRDRSSQVERKLINERDRVLAGAADADRESRMSHLQTLRLGLSVINVSIVTVPLMLTSDDQRSVGYSVLDEAIGTIDWNIPIYGTSSAGQLRPYPTLFSPNTGLDYETIRRGNAPAGTAQ